MAAEEIEALIVRWSEMPSADPARAGKTDVLVTWQWDAFHVFTDVVPAEEWSEERFRRLVAERWKKVRQWEGRTIKVKVG